MKKSRSNPEAQAAKDWFLQSVTFEGEPYIMDLEQAAAVVDDSKNALVVARAGSGKTRTLVAKIIYLVAQRHVDPNDILAFVFNANAAAEINTRLAQMLVDGHPVIGKAQIAATFHAFSRKIVYDLAGGHDYCGDILAEAKEAFMFALVQDLRQNPAWETKIRHFLRGQAEMSPGSADDAEKKSSDAEDSDSEDSDAKDSAPEDFNSENSDSEQPLTPEELRSFTGAMSQFVNRAQQKFLGSGQTLAQHLQSYQATHQVTPREQLFLELGAECFRRYHWRLLDEKARFPAFRNFRTDFNLLVSWAAHIIASHRPETDALLTSKKYLLIDEYQDFSGLFLAAVRSIRSVAQDAKLFAVGDDWQAINRFAGSDVDYFKNFTTYFPDDAKILQISTNYRCHYQIVDTARTFMQKAMHEKGNFDAFSQKPGEIFLVDPAQTPFDLAFVDYDDRVSPTDRACKQFVQALLGTIPKRATAQYLKTLVEIVKENPTASEILFLHRNNETGLQNITLEMLQKHFPTLLRLLGIQNVDNPQQRLCFMTMHKSKGLEADVVVLLEADEGIIPRVHPDTCLYHFFGETEEVVLDDQKRLFYVAMTRAKKRLYIIHRPADRKADNGFIPFLGKKYTRWHEDD